MSGFRHLGTDAFGVEEFLSFDEATQEVTIKRVFTPTYDPNFVLEKNKQELADNPKNMSKDKSFQKVASIPQFVHELWKTMYGVDPLAKGNEKLLERLLNDPEWREVRTSVGRVKLKG